MKRRSVALSASQLSYSAVLPSSATVEPAWQCEDEDEGELMKRNSRVTMPSSDVWAPCRPSSQLECLYEQHQQAHGAREKEGRCIRRFTCSG